MKILSGLFLAATRKNIQNQCLIDFAKFMGVKDSGRVCRCGVGRGKEIPPPQILSVGGKE
jgi:hypothetical protein